MIGQPIGGRCHCPILERHAYRPQALDRLPRAIDVIHAPASIPRSVCLLHAAQVGDRPIDRWMANSQADAAKGLQHPAGQIGGTGIDHRVVVGKRDLAEEFTIVVAIKRPPSTI